MKIVMSIIMVVALSACLPMVNQTTWSTQSRGGGDVTLSAAYDNAQKWAAQCNAQRSGLELSALGTAGLSLATGTAAGATLAVDESQQTWVALGAVLGAVVSSYLGVRTWYGARLYSKICMAYEGEQAQAE